MCSETLDVVGQVPEWLLTPQPTWEQLAPKGSGTTAAENLLRMRSPGTPPVSNKYQDL